MMKLNVKEDAVSPVVGVMLMIVVTVVIAAIIAAFSGALVANNNGPAPSIDFKATLSNETGLTLTSIGISNPNDEFFGVYIKNGDQEYKVGSDSVAGFTTGKVINIPTVSLRQGFINTYTAYDNGEGRTYEDSPAYINGTHTGNYYTVTLYNDNGETVLGKTTVQLTT